MEYRRGQREVVASRQLRRRRALPARRHFYGRQAAAGLGNVDVERSNGVIKLTGVVPRAEVKPRATELAKNVDGVRDVVNNIEVRAA